MTTAQTLRTLLLTALAPAIWGSSYIVTTQVLPQVDPVTISLLRALPAGLLLLLYVRVLPKGRWIPKMFVLGALNFSIFWSLLFFSAHRLPGGVAAVLGAAQPFIVIFAARGLLGAPIKPLSLIATCTGLFGIGLLLLTPAAKLDALGIVAGFAGAASMALGIVLSRKWQPPVDTLTFTAWQLTAGGLLLIPVAIFAKVDLAALTGPNLAGIAYLGLIGAALTYLLWFQGISKLHPFAVSVLGFLSPLTATALGWGILGEALGPLQITGMVIALGSVFLGQYAVRAKSAAA